MNERLKPQPNSEHRINGLVFAIIESGIVGGIIGVLAKLASFPLEDGVVKTIMGDYGPKVALGSLLVTEASTVLFLIQGTINRQQTTKTNPNA